MKSAVTAKIPKPPYEKPRPAISLSNATHFCFPFSLPLSLPLLVSLFRIAIPEQRKHIENQTIVFGYNGTRHSPIVPATHPAIDVFLCQESVECGGGMCSFARFNQ